MAKKVTVIKAAKAQKHTQEERRLKVCGYARVSTGSQAQATSYTAQVEYYTEKIESNPLWEFAGVYADEGISGTNVCLLYTSLNVVTALVIGLLTEQLAVVAVFTLSFMVLRSYTGGYHSDSRIFCYLGSNLVLLVPVYTQAVFYKTSLAWLLAVLLVSAGIIFLLSPMHSKNRKLDKEEQKHFGRKARLIAALELAVLGILWHAGQVLYAYAVYTGICITALFMLIGKAQLWIQSHTENR